LGLNMERRREATPGSVITRTHLGKRGWEHTGRTFHQKGHDGRLEARRSQLRAAITNVVFCQAKGGGVIKPHRRVWGLSGSRERKKWEKIGRWGTKSRLREIDEKGMKGGIIQQRDLKKRRDARKLNKRDGVKSGTHKVR